MNSMGAASRPPQFGNIWTERKLDLIERYLDAYTTVMTRQPFKLLYVDAFAGTGQVEIATDDDEGRAILQGSARRALTIDNRPFDRLLLIEKAVARYHELEALRAQHPGRDIRVRNEDANSVMQSLGMNWREWRGVLFLDPFGTQVDWATIQSICRTNALDTWILFPVGTVQRILPRSRRPENVSPRWASRLDRIYGGDTWKALYTPSQQLPLLGPRRDQRERGVSGLLETYRQQLRNLVKDRFLAESGTLRNSRGAPLFELLFFVGNRRGIGPAKRIAKHLLKDI